MTKILPIVLPALPASPIGASLVTIDASVLFLALVLVVASTIGFVVERAYVAWRGSRPRQARRAFHLVPMRRAA